MFSLVNALGCIWLLEITSQKYWLSNVPTSLNKWEQFAPRYANSWLQYVQKLCLTFQRFWSLTKKAKKLSVANGKWHQLDISVWVLSWGVAWALWTHCPLHLTFGHQDSISSRMREVLPVLKKNQSVNVSYPVHKKTKCQEKHDFLGRSKS